MTVLILMPIATQRGGAEQLLHLLMKHAQDREIRWIVVFLEEGPLRQTFDELGIQTYVVEAGRLRALPNYMRAIRHIVTLAYDTRADLVFSWMPKAHLYGGWAAQWAGVPAFWYQHGTPTLGWMDRLITLVPAKQVIACSHYIAEMQTSLWPQRPTTVVHPGVDLKRFNPDALPSTEEAKAKLDLPRGGPLIGLVGRLQRWKGPHVLVEALPHILDRYPNARAVIVGGKHDLEPDYPDVLNSRIESLNLADYVILAGYQSNIPCWMQAMDVIVHASDREPFGMVVIEAMALGKPVVAGVQGGPREIITEGTDGLLAPYEDADALAANILRYLDHPDWARSVGLAACQRARDFTAARFVERLKNAVHSLQLDSSSNLTKNGSTGLVL